MSYYQELGWAVGVAPSDQSICEGEMIGGRWLTTKAGAYCLGPDGKQVISSDDLAKFADGGEVINVTGKAPPLPPKTPAAIAAAKKKAFPWKPVLIGAAALLAIVLFTRKKGGAATSSPAPIAP